MLDAAESRGCFTPDEDDRVRQALLACRNCRLAACEIIFRHRDYAQIADENLRLRCFLVGFAAALLPGFWSHAALFLGSRVELDAIGVRQQAHGTKHWEDIPENPGRLGVVIEAISPRVRLCPLETSLNADHVVVLRPNLPPAEIAAAIGEALGHLGKPCDSAAAPDPQRLAARAPPPRIARQSCHRMRSLWYRGCHWLCARIYFERITVLHPERLPQGGPVLYIGLHRNGAVDGFVYRQVTAREMGIPAVMSVKDSLTRMKNGQHVRVDGAAGRVELLD